MSYQRSISFFVLAIAMPATLLASDLSKSNNIELSVFGMRAAGINVGVNDVKNVPTQPEIVKLVKAGLNLNGHLCAQITDIRPLKQPSIYEVSCIAYRDGSAKKSYLVQSLNGKAYEQ